MTLLNTVLKPGVQREVGRRGRFALPARPQQAHGSGLLVRPDEKGRRDAGHGLAQRGPRLRARPPKQG